MFRFLASRFRGRAILTQIQRVCAVVGKRLELFILDVRVLGAFSKGEMAHLHELMPNCIFDSELAPAGCKYLNVSYFKCFRVSLGEGTKILQAFFAFLLGQQ